MEFFTNMKARFCQPGAGNDARAPSNALGPVTITTNPFRGHDKSACDPCRKIFLLPLESRPRHTIDHSPDVFAAIWERALKQSGVLGTPDDWAACFLWNLHMPLRMRMEHRNISESTSYADMIRAADDLWPQLVDDEALDQELLAHLDAMNRPKNKIPLTHCQAHEQTCSTCKTLKPLEAQGTPVWQGGRNVLDFAIKWEQSLAAHRISGPPQMLAECFFYRLLSPLQDLVTKERHLDPSNTPYVELMRAAIEVEAGFRRASLKAMEKLRTLSNPPADLSQILLPTSGRAVDLTQVSLAELNLAGLEVAAQHKANNAPTARAKLNRNISTWLGGIDFGGWDEATALAQLADVRNM